MMMRHHDRDRDELIQIVVRNLWHKNQRRTKEEWIPLLDAVAIAHQTTPDHIETICNAYVNSEQAYKLILTDDNVWRAIKHSYMKAYKPKEHMIVFNFETKAVVPNGKTSRVMADMHTQLLNISGRLYESWIAHPHANEFEKYARLFNISANKINMMFDLQDKWLIPFAIPPKQHSHIPKVKYLKGLVHCPMTGGEPIDEILPSWIDEFTQFVDDNNHADMEQIKCDNPELYNHITTFHRDNMVVLHWTSNSKKCVWPLAGLNFLATQFIQRLTSRLCVIKESTDISALTFHIPNTHPSKKKSLQWSITPKIGSIFIKCPCIENGKECGACFNLSDPNILRTFKDIFKNAPQDAATSVKDLFTLIQTMLNAPPDNYRTQSCCPKCQHSNISYEAQRNYSGANPHLKHPSDMICESCNFEYCTDCNQSHPGHICRGFKPNEDPGEFYQACPGCKVVTERISGCSFMKCGNRTCNKMWCWMCRCFRYEEQDADADGSRNHYCITVNHFRSNPHWANNREFKPYTNESPPSPDGGADWVPL